MPHDALARWETEGGAVGPTDGDEPSENGPWARSAQVRTDRRTVIVVGIDGSTHGTEALKWSRAEARLRNARICAIHAWNIPGLLRPGELAGRFNGLLNTLRDSAAQVLIRELETTGVEGNGVAVDEVIVKQHPAEALIRASANADLLVVGSRGLGSLAGVLLGSVSQQCVQHARCPIAVVHSANHGDRRRIVVGFDGSAGAKDALEWAKEEAGRRNTSLLVVCAYNESPAVAGGGPWSAGALSELRRGLQLSAERVLEEAARSVDGIPVSTSAVHGSAASELLRAASDAQLLVVGSRGRGGFANLVLGSVSQHCAAHASGAVVVVRGSSSPNEHAS